MIAGTLRSPEQVQCRKAHQSGKGTKQSNFSVYLYPRWVSRTLEWGSVQRGALFEYGTYKKETLEGAHASLHFLTNNLLIYVSQNFWFSGLRIFRREFSPLKEAFRTVCPLQVKIRVLAHRTTE